MAAEAILFIEDDDTGREVALFNLRKAGYEVDGAADGEEGLRLFAPSRHVLVVTDVRMPGISGLDVLARLREAAPDVPVIVITAYGNVEVAVDAMKAGAADFIGKPFNRDHLLLAVERALEGRRMRDELRTLRIQAAGVERPIIHESAAMAAVVALADKVAGSDVTVLVTGETGTGKELVARRIHARGRRAERPFVALNCAAIPPDLLESELFGHEKGAFTGATRRRAGKIRQAAGGTLFLDEVSELPLPLQSKLLRVLQERQVDVVGADRPVDVDVRIVAATNRDLTTMATERTFREDLLYRLKVVEIHVPPLRERPADIVPLVRHFVRTAAEGRDIEVPDHVVAALQARQWPGNVRELENACERLVVLAENDVLDPADLPPTPGSRAVSSGAAPEDAWPPLPADGLSLVDLEKSVIERVLRMQNGNVSAAARYLSVPRHILTYRMEKYGIGREG